ncbi:pimeloyl-ACP methyl ester carboxylesterase [Methylorubrum rhodinum]|uniref:Pimeloyl-ACP methyl ester carboxylesterase n=1 Tax=Methylorubrum rhodinum TaxID=29428 RepID=A0A840ZFA5_9HYPH|nr:alpha/beta fold hydrolase [Methylorubrum rhodinum]MBB5755855.1 pimeloyl-ACP methyl ester carboxylesterase [Methylorubrum rhodinum]
MGGPASLTTRILDLTVAGQPVPTPCMEVGTGPAALLLPALSSISAREEMRPLARELAADHRCRVPDWPGFGAHERVRVPLEPATYHAFLDALLAAAPGPYALAVAAGHAAPYLAAAARRHPGAFGRLVLVAPTWRGPLPTAMGPHRARWFERIRKAVEMPLVGEALYRINISPPIIGRMMRAHVYAEAEHVTPEVIRAKHRITRQRNGRFGTAAFVTGGLDPVGTREDFLGLFGPDLPPVRVLRPERAPRRSGAEMDALIEAGGVEARTVPGALSPHEEFSQAVAAAIRA